MMPGRGAPALALAAVAVLLISIGGWLVLRSGGAAAGTAPARAGELAAAQQANGARVWGERCVACHQPGSIGVVLTADVLSARRTALGLFQYLRIAMPHEAPGSLPERDYWDVTAFLLAEHGFVADTFPLSPDGAGEVELRYR